MSKKRKIDCTYFFRDYNGTGVFRLIFSFINENKDVFSFGLVTKQLFFTLKSMLKKSSNKEYQYEVLTNNPNRIDNCFDIFSKNLEGVNITILLAYQVLSTKQSC